MIDSRPRRTKPVEKRAGYLPDIHRALPQSLDAEKGVLCSALLAPEVVLPQCRERLEMAAFYHPAHQIIYREILALDGAGKPVEFIGLTQLLKDKGELDKAGGAAAISELFTFVMTASNVDYYLDIVCEKHQLRQLIQYCTEFAGRAHDEQGEVKLLLDEAERKFSGIGAVKEKAGKLPAIVNAAALLESSPPVPDDLIEGVLHRGSKLVLGGGSKSFKTWSLLDMGISVATGADWWGFPTEQGRVLYVNFEIQEGFFAGRIREVCAAKGLTSRPMHLDLLNLRGFAADADVILPEITAQMVAGDYALVILDPLYKLLGSRDENASRDMADLMNGIERLAVKTGAAVAFGSHFAKGNASGKESMDRISGSGVFARDPDSILTMTRHEEEDAFTVELTLRNHPPEEAFVVRRRHPLMVRDGTLDPAKLKQVGGREPTHKPEDALIHLTEPMGSAEWQAACEEHEDMSESTFYRLLKKLKKSEKIRKSAIDQKWSRKG